MQLRTQAKTNIDRKVINRVDCHNILHEELVDRKIKDFDEIYTVFTIHEIGTFNVTLRL